MSEAVDAVVGLPAAAIEAARDSVGAAKQIASSRCLARSAIRWEPQRAVVWGGDDLE